MKKIKLIDFRTNSFFSKTPFEIEFICQHSLNPKELDLRYTGFHNVVVETQAFYRFQQFFRKNKFYTESFKIATWENIEPCFQTYEEGFIKGYNELTETIKENTALFSNDFQNTAKQVFQFILRPSTFVSFSNIVRKGKSIQVLKKEQFFNSGIKEGEKYRAWFYIMENPDYFINLFRNHKPFIDFYRKVIDIYKDESYMSGVVERLQEILKEIDVTDEGNIMTLNILKEKNNFDSIEIRLVYNHFKEGLVKKNYLSEGELIKFINAAFIKKKIPKNLFSLHDVNAKRKISRVFFNYYKDLAGKPHGKQNKYAALLGDYFHGYKTNTLITNFSK